MRPESPESPEPRESHESHEQPPVTAVAEAHAALRRLVSDVNGVDDARLAAPSPLPGWSRGHVLAHLTDNARMFARLAEHALRGELVPGYEGGQAERDAIIEATASRTADEHRAALAEHTAALERIWSRIPDGSWTLPVTFRNADIATTVFARWREAWIHMADLDLGVTPADWPDDLAAHAIDFLLVRLPQGTRLRATDTARAWGTGPGHGTAPDPSTDPGPGPEITGGVRDLAAWLAGRTPAAAPEARAGLPPLGPWPPHPKPVTRR